MEEQETFPSALESLAHHQIIDTALEAWYGELALAAATLRPKAHALAEEAAEAILPHGSDQGRAQIAESMVKFLMGLNAEGGAAVTRERRQARLGMFKHGLAAGVLDQPATEG